MGDIVIKNLAEFNRLFNSCGVFDTTSTSSVEEISFTSFGKNIKKPSNRVDHEVYQSASLPILENQVKLQKDFS